jgi:alkane 1-monooxygenase
VFYGHFYVEHNRGHHVRVATPEDPASSRLGESFYAFWPRTVVGSVRSAWRLESTRLRRRHRRTWGMGNDVLSAWAMTVVLWAAMIAWLGVGVLPYLLLQAFVGFTLLEAVNYLEHYGLLRQRVGFPGRERYERVEARHSWNSNHVTTNVLLYHLQRHSDHHANPTRRYQSLRDFPDAPVLPAGYAGMILLALVPPLWRRVMDPRLLAHLDGDVALANIQPRRRSRVLARYGAAAPDAAARADLATMAVPESAGTPVPVGAAQCPGCFYIYDERVGAPREGFPPGTPLSQIPDTWCCPDCGVREKVDFVPVSVASA